MKYNLNALFPSFICTYLPRLVVERKQMSPTIKSVNQSSKGQFDLKMKFMKKLKADFCTNSVQKE